MVKAASTAAGQDYTPLIIGGAAFLLLAKYAVDQVPNIPNPFPAVIEKSNIVPESGEFLRGLFYGAEPDYFYAEDQSGSPNPPTQAWWEMDQAGLDAGPIALIDGGAVPTSPIIGTTPASTAERWGGNVREFFTEGKIFPRTPFGNW